MLVSLRRNIFFCLTIPTAAFSCVIAALAVISFVFSSCNAQYNTELLTDVTQKARFAPEPLITRSSPQGNRNFFLTTENLQISLSSSLSGATIMWRTNEETTYSPYLNLISRSYTQTDEQQYDIHFYAYTTHPDYNPSGETNIQLRYIPSNVIIRISGRASSLGGFSGDGYDSRGAQYHSQTAILSYNGCTYIADTGNHRIRRINTNGDIHTILGDGNTGDLLTQVDTPTALAIAPGSPPVLYISDTGNARVLRIIDPEADTPSAELVNVPLTNAPGPLAYYNSVLYIADINLLDLTTPSENRIIACTNPQNDTPSTSVFVENTTVRGMTVDTTGRLIFSTAENNIVRIDAGTSVTIYAYATPANILNALHEPTALACASNGDLYIADSGNHRIVRITVNNLVSGNTTIGIVSGTGTQGYEGNGSQALEAMFNNPTSITFETKTSSNSTWFSPMEIDAMTGDLLISDTGNHMIREILHY